MEAVNAMEDKIKKSCYLLKNGEIIDVIRAYDDVFDYDVWDGFLQTIANHDLYIHNTKLDEERIMRMDFMDTIKGLTKFNKKVLEFKNEKFHEINFMIFEGEYLNKHKELKQIIHTYESIN